MSTCLPMTRTGRHRAVGMPDLLTAVLAAAHRVTLIHYDAGFDVASEVVAVDHRWVLPRGSL